MFNAKYKLKLNLNYSFLETNTGGPRYMQSFYLRFHVYATQNWPFFWNPSSNLHSSLVFLYAISLYASLFFQSLSLTYNEGHLYSQPKCSQWQRSWLKQRDERKEDRIKIGPTECFRDLEKIFFLCHFWTLWKWAIFVRLGDHHLKGLIVEIQLRWKTLNVITG